jgi:hypothetical protein
VNHLEANKNICDLFSPVSKYISLSCNKLEEKSTKLIYKYSEDLSFHILEEILHIRKIHRSTFQNGTEIPPLMLMNEIHAKIIDRFCERLYCPISLW